MELWRGAPDASELADQHNRRAIELAHWSRCERGDEQAGKASRRREGPQASRPRRAAGEKWQEARQKHEEEEEDEETNHERRPTRRGGRRVAIVGRRAGEQLAPTWPRFLFPTCVSLILYLVISSLSNGGGGGADSRHKLGLPLRAYAFNIDTQTAVVQAGPEQSFFGYSVAQHRDRGVNHLLVGAPKAQTDQPKTANAGAVYKCAPLNARACQQIPFDPTGSSILNLRGERVQSDDKSRQWFGASLQSATDNGSILACAPAYVYLSVNQKRRDPVGACWVSRGSFGGFFDYSPCRLNDQWGHNRLGSCQAGFASAITKDGGRMFAAAPGSHVWQGQVFMHNLNNDLTNKTSAVNPREDDSYLGYSLALGRFSSSASSAAASAADSDLAIGVPRGDDLVGKVMLVDRELRTLRNLTGEQMGAYFGYSLAVADVNGDGLDDLIVGAPNYYNQSTSHKEPHFDRGRVYVALQSQRHEFAIVQRLDGRKNRARFGTALANCGDLNRDGLQDLAVGAPHDGPEGRGAVYIYMGRRDGPSGGVSHEPDQVIYAESVGREGHLLRAFGFALSAGLDMDGNQYPDLLVGDYKADRAVLLRARPVAVALTSISFQPENFNLDDRSCLLANSSTAVSCITVQYCTKYSGLNVDNKLAFVYDIKLDTENKGAPRLFFLNNEGKSEERNTSTLTKDVQQCRSFKAYIMRQIRDKLTPFKIDIDYNLAGDHPQAAGDQHEPVAGQTRLRPVLSKAPGKPMNQMSRTAMIQRNCGPDNICVPDLKLTMAANLDSYTIGTNDKLLLDVTVRNSGEDAFESMFYLTMPMSINFITINKTRSDYPVCYGAKPEQTGENVLTCDLGNPQARNDVVKFTVITEPARGGQLSQADFTFAALVNSTNPELDEKRREDNQVQIGIPIRVEFQLSLSGNSQPPRWVHNSTHQQQQQQQISQQLQMQRQTEPLAKLARMSEADVGPEIYHTYQLQNRGPSMINDIALTILWPSKTSDGANYLLYLVDEPLTSDRVRCKPAPDDTINPLGLRYLRGNSLPAIEANVTGNAGAGVVKTPIARDKRQAPAPAPAPEQQAQSQTTSVDESILQLLNLPSCGPSQCVRFECNVNNLANNEIATIKIRSRLFEETISKLSLQEFSISSKLIAQIKSLPYNVSTQSMPPYSYKVETQLLTTGIAVQDLLPWWLIALAILIGIILFALLACFLKYLGFFARKRPPKTAEREQLTPAIWNDYQYTPGDTAL